MKNERKIITCFTIMLCFFGTTLASVVAAETGFGTITVQPASPTALSTITLTTTINEVTPPEVYITVEECNAHTGVCYKDVQNISMIDINSSTFRAIVTLKHADATYITLIASAKTNGVWVKSTKKIVNLSEGSNGTPDGNGKKTPGFELVMVMIAIAMIALIIRRKRF